MEMDYETLSESLLIEKLSSLTSSHQSIESLSLLCISERNKAKLIVETWQRLFTSRSREQQIAFLFLANDIIQNSRRHCSEFVTEFWKIIPGVLKNFFDNGDVTCRKTALRLVEIWDERRVFGSRGQNLIDIVLSDRSPGNDAKNSNPMKKLAAGGLPERIARAFELIDAEVVNDEEAYSICRNVVPLLENLEKDIRDASSQGSQPSSDVLENVWQQELILHQCVNQLEKSCSLRNDLLFEIVDAIKEQESKLDLIQNELAVAQKLIEKAANMRPTLSASSKDKLALEENTKAKAAAIAAKLSSLPSPAEMLKSIVAIAAKFSSTPVTEESAFLSSGLKRPKLNDEPFSFYNMNTSQGSSSAYFPSSTSKLPPIQANNGAPWQLPLPANSSANQSMGRQPYGYGATSLVPTTMPSNVSMGLVRQGPPPQQAANGQYYMPVGTGNFGPATHWPAPPRMHRQ